MEKKIFNIQWHITNICNLRCSHCYQNEYESDQSLDNLKKIYENMENFLIKHDMYADIALTGGEPLLYQHFNELLEYLSQKERVNQIIILSNGTLITEKMAHQFKNNKVSLVQVSLDGGKKEIHESIRGKGSFDKTLIGVKNLKKEGIIVQAQMVVHKNNIDSIDSFVNLCEENKIDRLLVTRLVLEGNAITNLKEMLLTKEQFKELLFKLERYSNEEDIHVKILKGRCLWRLINPSYGSICPIGINSISILPNGDALACRRLPVSVGNLLEKSFYNIWYKSDILWEFRNKNKLKGKCGQCISKEVCGGCRAVAYSVFNDYLQEDPYCWK